ncbi:crossover junction endodeoxyribonuclease RuvC [Candidatus Berkelbacteria bacterium]|nr:crossover junction endodeoxyribonuclease RuvC [Candidatus Berkelbacteria bacterium]
MRIIGIDPGIGITGWSIVDQLKSPLLVAAGTIETKPKSPTATRLVAIHDQLTALLVKFLPDQLAIEKLFFARNVTTAMAVSQARGIILFGCASAGLSIYEYTPLQIKQAIVGYGRATKPQVNQMLPHHIEGQVPKQDDAADAIAVAVTHLACFDNNQAKASLEASAPA